MDADKELRKLRAEIAKEIGQLVDSVVDRIYELGRIAGQEEARDRVLDLFGQSPTPAITPPEPKQPNGEDADSDRLPYGAVKDYVRRVLMAHPDGLKKFKIPGWCLENLGVQIKPESLTEALRSLARDGDALNVERGRWAPSPKLLGSEDSGAGAPEVSQSNESREGQDP